MLSVLDYVIFNPVPYTQIKYQTTFSLFSDKKNEQTLDREAVNVLEKKKKHETAVKPKNANAKSVFFFVV